MKGKLNSFQRSVLQWNDIQAYNAVEVMKIPGMLDLQRLNLVINSELEQLGLTGFFIDRSRGTFCYLGGPADYRVEPIAVDAEMEIVIQKVMEKELNTPFRVEGAINPFRFFVIPTEDQFYLGLVYFHVIAGTESIVLLLKHLVKKYLRQETVFPYPLEVYPGGYGQLTPGNLLLTLRKIMQFPSQVKRLRRSSKPPHRDDHDHTMGLYLFSLTALELNHLLDSAKSWGVTLNDLFIALLLQSLAPLDLKRLQAPRRRLMTIGSIVNIRQDLKIDLRTTFGLFLSFFSVGHTLPEGTTLEDLAKDIRRQTGKIKTEKRYLGTQIELGLGRFLVSLQSQAQKEKFYPKAYPLWGGITNINLNPLWDTVNEPLEIDYLRSVSTGPFTPLVLSITTIGEIANVGLIYKKTVFSKSEIEGVISTLQNSVKPVLLPKTV